jgi:hypothetical protein
MRWRELWHVAGSPREIVLVMLIASMSTVPAMLLMLLMLNVVLLLWLVLAVAVWLVHAHAHETSGPTTAVEHAMLSLAMALVIHAERSGLEPPPTHSD